MYGQYSLLTALQGRFSAIYIDVGASRKVCAHLIYDNKRRCRNISKKELSINHGIRDKEIRVIDEDGSQLGISLRRR